MFGSYNPYQTRCTECGELFLQQNLENMCDDCWRKNSGQEEETEVERDELPDHWSDEQYHGEGYEE